FSTKNGTVVPKYFSKYNFDIKKYFSSHGIEPQDENISGYNRTMYNTVAKFLGGENRGYIIPGHQKDRIQVINTQKAYLRGSHIMRCINGSVFNAAICNYYGIPSYDLEDAITILHKTEKSNIKKLHHQFYTQILHAGYFMNNPTHRMKVFKFISNYKKFLQQEKYSKQLNITGSKIYKLYRIFLCHYIISRRIKEYSIKYNHAPIIIIPFGRLHYTQLFENKDYNQTLDMFFPGENSIIIDLNTTDTPYIKKLQKQGYNDKVKTKIELGISNLSYIDDALTIIKKVLNIPNPEKYYITPDFTQAKKDSINY
ncbi:MAG: hypothetical protein AAGA27_07310, partial [Pseudomonadota bacterium]